MAYGSSNAQGKAMSLETLGVTATADELNSLAGITGSVQEQLDDKETKGSSDVALAQAKSYADTKSSEAMAATEKALADATSYTDGKIQEIKDAGLNAAPTESPNFTGVPTAPTAEQGTNTDQIATTKYVEDAVADAVEQAVESMQPEKSSLVLEAAKWTGETAPYTYAVEFEGHDNTTDLVELMVGDGMTMEQIQVLQSANIVYAEWTTNTTLTLYAYGAKPVIDAPVSIVIR